MIGVSGSDDHGVVKQRGGVAAGHLRARALRVVHGVWV